MSLSAKPLRLQIRIAILFGLAACLVPLAAHAATYVLPTTSGPFSNCSYNGSTLSCSGNVILGNNDELVVNSSNTPLTLNVTGDFTFGNNFIANQGGSTSDLSIVVGGNMNPGNNAILNADLTVDGSINTGNNSEYTGTLEISGNLNLGNGSTVDGDINVEGSVNVGNNVEIEGTIAASGSVNIGNNTTVDGNVLADGSVNNNGTVTGDINSPSVAGNEPGGTTCDINDNETVCEGGAGPVPNLELEWRMEEPSWDGTADEVVDTSANGRPGTSQGGSQTVFMSPVAYTDPIDDRSTCRYGYFDGVDSGINGGSIDFDVDNEITVMAWIRWDGDPATGSPAASIATSNDAQNGNTGQFWLQHSTNNDAFEFAVQNDSGTRVTVQSNTTPQADTWYHVVGVYDGSQLKIYVNGTDDSASTASLTGNIAAIDPGFQFHAGRWTPTADNAHRFRGNIDAVRVFNFAFDATKVEVWRKVAFACDVEPSEFDHLRVTHPASTLTCTPETIEVRACVDSSCSTLLNDSVSVDFTSPSQGWQPASFSFTEQDSTTLQVTTPGTATIDASSTPSAVNGLRCFTGTTETACTFDVAEAGFLLDVPDHVAADVVSGTIEAVAADPNDPSRCVPGFDNGQRDITFASSYLNPGSGTLPINVDSTAASGTAVTLSFDNNAVANFDLDYADVGEVQLDASYTGSGNESGLVMQGNTSFITRPADFSLGVPNNPGATSATDPVFETAGIPFPVEVSALNLNGSVTPNFGQESPVEGVILELALVAPAGAEAPALTTETALDFAIAEDCDGNAAPGTACGSFAWPEVGIIELTPRLASGAYLGTSDVIGTTEGPIGRFIPDRFELTAGALENRSDLTECASSPFTYFGETLNAEFTIEAVNSDGALTQNYRDSFAKLSDVAELNLATIDAGATVTTVAGNWGTATLTWDAGEILQLSLPFTPDRGTPQEPVDPFRIGTRPVDDDGVTLANANLTVTEGGSDTHWQIGQSELRFGRLLIDNAVGSELAPLELPLRAEYWDECTWKRNASDSCSTLDRATQLSLQGDGVGPVSGDTSIDIGSSGTTQIDANASTLTLGAGEGTIQLTAPQDQGWVEVLSDLESGAEPLPFLRDDPTASVDSSCSVTGDFTTNPSARATFGLFEGNPDQVLLQELAPQ